MGKLHELLAVEADKQGEFTRVCKETLTTFAKKAAHFTGHVRTLELRDEERKQEEEAAREETAVVTTVGDKLRYASESAIRYFNSLQMKEGANQQARADLVIEGTVIAKDLPATFLLALESKLKAVREYFEAIPTHDPSVMWEPDEAQRPGIYRTQNPQVSEKFEKKKVYPVMSPATTEHPAQIDQVMETTVAGLYRTIRWSGMISPAQKSALLGRVDKLIRAVKVARQRANQVDVPKGTSVGKAIFEYLLEDV